MSGATICKKQKRDYKNVYLARQFVKNIVKGTTDPRVEFISQVQTKILINFHLQNLDQASTSKSKPNISLSIKLKLQNLDQTLCSKSEQKFNFFTKPQLRNLQQIVANTALISNSYNINKFGVGIFTRQGDVNQVY